MGALADLDHAVVAWYTCTNDDEEAMSTTTLTVPKHMIEEVLHATEAVMVLHDDLENYLIAHHPGLLKKLHHARREHLAGKTRPFVPRH